VLAAPAWYPVTGEFGHVQEHQVAQSDKRRSILNAAIGVFARNGFYNSKVADIAREAGVADGTIYLYFKNKEDLLIQVFLDTMDTVLEAQEAALQGLTDPVERLRSIVRVHFSVVESQPALAEVITVELRQSSRFMRSTDLKPFGRYLALMARTIDQGKQAGAFAPEVEPRRAARALFGVMDELALEWAMSPDRYGIGEACDLIINLFLNGLRARS
jgi:TetR/AcrR family transcriptional regulator, fatty acid metabolism regulator protein